MNTSMLDDPRIQDHEWKVGDACLIEGELHYVTDFTLNHLAWFNKPDPTDEVCIADLESPPVFLPSIEDHIEALMASKKWPTEMALKIAFDVWCGNYVKSYHDTTIKELWLRFRMSELHGLTWSEGKWK